MNNIDLNTPIDILQKLLSHKDWLITNETITSTSSPGEGNMNVVIRVTTNLRSFVLKQSRPFVQKYQQVPAPLDRINTEYQFYQSMSQSDNSSLFPKVLHYDSTDHLMMINDIGDCDDMTLLYKSGSVHTAVLRQLIKALYSIHQSDAPIGYPDNMELRRLNHQHIFVLPFMEDNGFNLENIQIGLSELSVDITSDGELLEIIGGLGELYLSEGSYLLHGDYYPGSWMSIGHDIIVLDPEFSFIGFREYDLGVMVAHLVMATGDTNYLKQILEEYPDQVNKDLTSQIAGIEIIRRLLGLAQLPMVRSLTAKKKLIDWAVLAIKL